MRRLIVAGLLALVTPGVVGSSLPAASAVALVSHHPRVSASRPGPGGSALGWASSNWSGYAITGTSGAFSSVSGEWVVPAVSRTKKASYSASWVGIDGFNNSDLIQTGTEQDWYSGSAHYSAWWEILPSPETVIHSLTVKPGDVMTARITKGSSGSWTITITDGTTGSFTTTQTYSGPQTSAEWIEEAPTVGGRIATLAHYGSTTFGPGFVNGADPGLVASDGGVMIQNRTQVSTPSNPDSDTDGFNTAYGSKQPSPPGS